MSRYHGNPAEDIVGKVLKKMQNENCISGFIRNNQNDWLDKEGIDFLIFLKNDLVMPLQVKTSSLRKDGKKAARHFQKHPLVKFLIFVPIHEKQVCEIVEEKLKTILKKYSPQ